MSWESRLSENLVMIAAMNNDKRDNAPESPAGMIERALGTYLAFPYFVLRHFLHDRCLRVAASLSYTSLLALVPLTAVSFAILAEVPYFDTMQGEMQAYIFDNFMPDAGGHVIVAFENFVDNARKMGTVGLIGLAVVAILLLNTILSALNLIFRVRRSRPLWRRLILFFGILLIGPVVVAASFALAGTIVTMTKGMGLDAFTGPLGRLARAGPAAIMVLGLSVFYWAVPNRRILWRDAFLGGLVGGLLFSGLRWGFSLYLVYFPTYQAIYGTLSAIPVFLVWMYLSWAVILTGAVVAAAKAEWREKESPESG